jgi:hypothetical protein
MPRRDGPTSLGGADSTRSPEGEEGIELLKGNSVVNAAGARYYEGALRALLAAGGRSRTELSVLALLVPEPENPHDQYAVQVLVHGQKVGYIPGRKAKELQRPLIELQQQSGRQVGCRARIVDGRGGGRKDKGEPRVELFFDPRELAPSAMPADTPRYGSTMGYRSMDSEPSAEEILTLLTQLDAAGRLDHLVERYANKRAFPGGVARTLHHQVSVSIGVRDLLDDVDFSEAEVDAAFELAQRKCRLRHGEGAVGFSLDEVDVGVRVLALRFLRGATKRSPGILDCRHELSRGEMPGDRYLAESLTIWMNTVRSIDDLSWLRCPVTGEL